MSKVKKNSRELIELDNTFFVILFILKLWVPCYNNQKWPVYNIEPNESHEIIRSEAGIDLPRLCNRDIRGNEAIQDAEFSI